MRRKNCVRNWKTQKKLEVGFITPCSKYEALEKDNKQKTEQVTLAHFPLRKKRLPF